MSRIFKAVAPIALGLVGNVIAPGIGGYIGSAVGGAATSKNKLLGAVTGAAGFGLGQAAGSALSSAGIGTQTIGGALGAGAPVAGGVGPSLGALTSSSLGRAIANTTLANVAGGALAGAIMSESQPAAQQTQGAITSANLAPAPKPKPTRPGELPTPKALQGLDPLQQRSRIASYGVSGFLPSDENKAFYSNLVRRSIIDDRGSYSSENLLPVDKQFLAQVMGIESSDPEEIARRLQFG